MNTYLTSNVQVSLKKGNSWDVKIITQLREVRGSEVRLH